MACMTLSIYPKSKLRFAKFACVLSAALFAVPALAQDQSIDIENGLYAYTSNIAMSGSILLDEAGEHCLTDEHTTLTVDELLGELNQNSLCKVSNVVIKDRRAQGDLTCTIDALGGATATGKVIAGYSRTELAVKAEGRVAGFLPISATLVARRIGDCPMTQRPSPT